MKKTLKVAVTGGNGFIGTEILRELKKNKIKFISLQKSKKNIITSNIYHFDLSRLNKNRLSVLSGIDVVVHSAALVHKGPLTEKEYLKLNFEGTKILFEKCKKFGVKKFIFLSTMSVYGFTSSKSKIDIHCLANPKNNYAKSKHLSEQYLLSQKSPIKISIIRLPSIYGNNSPGQFGILEKLAIKNIPLPFLGIRNKRSMISVNLVAKIITKISKNMKLYLGLQLLCENKAYSIEYLIKKIRNKNKIPLRLFFFPKILIKFFLFFLGKSETYKRIYENLEFVSTINIKKIFKH